MDKERLNIAVVETSDMLFEGLTNLLLKDESHFYIYRVSNLEELNMHCLKDKIDIVIINPIFLLNVLSEFNKLRKAYSRIKWIGLMYSHYDREIISKLDNTISIHDSAEFIVKKLKLIADNLKYSHSQQDELSERETDVLIQLLKGQSNKEIADELHISIHTVISHRKNIVEKTGIKSLPGLTIYAISKKIIPMESN